MKVLIVDDDVVDRQIVKRALLLGSVSYELVEAETVDEGLALYASQHFDLVMVDFRMPGRDGIELVMAIREGDKEKSSAVVMMSNSEDEQVALDAIRAGAQDFILKSELSASRLRRAILHAQTRFDLEQQLKSSFNEVKVLAERDPLTGLANRHLFDESLKISVANNRRHTHKLALLLIDLDNFKYVNDSFGHDVGDFFLKRVVIRINSCLRGNELFARLGGDEFAITLTNLVDEREASLVAQRIIRVLDKPFEIDGRSFRSGASIGISMHPENGMEPEDLLKNADIAMYRAKKLGKNQACFFMDEMQEQFLSRYQTELELRQALEKKEFIVNYQPIYGATTHELYGFEALIQWRDARGLRSTREFLKIAEESKLIIDIGRWVIEQAISQQVEWRKLTGVEHVMSINLSPLQLANGSTSTDIETLMTKYEAEPTSFVFEINEVSLQGHERDIRSSIQSIHALGCRIALDDFGAGKSSICNLRSFPIDLVKVDPSFLPSVTSSVRDKQFFSSVVALIKSLDFELVVVGTETVEQIELCCSLSVDKLQGHFFGRPEPVGYVEENFLRRI